MLVEQAWRNSSSPIFGYEPTTKRKDEIKSTEDRVEGSIHPALQSYDEKWKMELHYKGPSKIQRDGGKFHSQVGQDKTVMSIFENKKKGYFVDCAANDAVHLSNTLALETHLGWGGLCIEPHPKYHTGYTNRRCTLVDAVVGQKDDDEITFYFKDAMSGITGFDQGKSKNGTKFRTVSLETLFDKLRLPPVIDYLSLDVEGAELHIMEKFPFHKYKFQVMTVERPKMLRVLLEKHGYVYVMDHGGCVLFVLWVHFVK